MTTAAERLFVDTNILVYATDPRSPWHAIAAQALNDARREGIELVISPQILREYKQILGCRWAPATKLVRGDLPSPLSPPGRVKVGSYFGSKLSPKITRERVLVFHRREIPIRCPCCSRLKSSTNFLPEAFWRTQVRSQEEEEISPPSQLAIVTAAVRRTVRA